ncbi:MAG: replication protein [Erysipelotrichaceae bacterium]
MKQDSRSRKWQITINNPHDHKFNHDAIIDTIQEFKNVLYYCLADEVGENGTYHTHIYIVANNAIRFSTMKNKFSTAHFEIARGTSSDNRDYIFKLGKWKSHKKNETNLSDTHKEWGEIPIERQGSRNDLADLYDMIKQGMDNFEILESTPEQLMNIDRIERARQVVRENQYRNQFRELTVTYISGSTETGKTRHVMEHHGYNNVYRVTDYKHPFDGYQGQPVICFEEFRSSLPIASMLNYLDGYPLELPCRYNNKIACYNTVYIISNIVLTEQYTYEQHAENETWNALLRRIQNIITF